MYEPDVIYRNIIKLRLKWKWKSSHYNEITWKILFRLHYFSMAEAIFKVLIARKWSQSLNSLTRLEITECKIGGGSLEGWLRHLTALEELCIEGCRGELVDMVEEIKHLQFLKRLTLKYVYDMVPLPQGLQHTPSLQSLKLYGLDRLTSLPDWLSDLASLMELIIGGCPAIPSLPSSIREMRNLRYLWIEGCPQLQIRCVEPNGEDWHNIDHIPFLYIEYPF